MVKEINKEQFAKKVLQSDKPVVVDIYTDRCPNCKVLAPIFEETSNANSSQYNFYKLNASENIEIAKQYKVLGVPSLLFFSHGKLVVKKTGVQSQQNIEKRLAPLLDFTDQMAQKKELTGYFKWPWQ